MKTTTKNKINPRQLIKIMLLSGKRLTKYGLDRRFDVTNSAEIINQLRKSGMAIETQWKVSKNGKRYGEYVYIPPKKVDRIKTRAYMRCSKNILSSDGGQTGRVKFMVHNQV